MATSIQTAFPMFFDNEGVALDGGQVYIGVAGDNPELSPQSVFWDAALTVAATQPLETVKGRIVRNGVVSEAFIDGAGGYSIVVRDGGRRIVNSSLNVGGSPTADLSFDGRSAFTAWRAAGNTAPDGSIASDGTVQYVASAGATAIADLPGWLPFGVIRPDHWAENTTPGTTDMTAAFQSASDYVSSAGAALEGIVGTPYGISEASGNGVSVGGDGVSVSNLELVALGSWTSGSFVIRIGEVTASTDKLTDMVVENVFVRGGHAAQGGINFLAMQAGNVSNCRADQCLEAQIKIGSADGNDSNSCTDTTFFNLSTTEWEFGEGSGETDYALRTSKGLWVGSSDVKIFGGAHARAQHCLYVEDCFNVTIIGSIFYAGPTRTDPLCQTAYVQTNANRLDLLGCRIDDGATVVRSFNVTIRSCRFIQYGAANQLQLVATSASETAETFQFTDNNLSNFNSASLDTDGGSWGSFAGVVSGNIGANGAEFDVGGVVSRLNDEIYTDNAGQLRPVSDGQGSLGSAANRFAQVSAVDFRYATGDVKDTSGSGSPEGVVFAGVGSTYRRTDGSAGIAFYVKEGGGAGNTGWVAK